LLSSVVLAAGESSRFNGKIKALLKTGETTFIGKIIKDLFNQELKEIILVFGAHYSEIMEHLQVQAFQEEMSASKVTIKKETSKKSFNWRILIEESINKKDEIKVVLNRDWKKGQLSSLREGIKNLSPESEGLLFTLVDHPLVERRTYAKLISRWKEKSDRIVIPTYMGRKGHPAIFPKRLYKNLLEEELTGGARELIYREIDSVIFVPVSDSGVVSDIDNLEDYNRIIKKNRYNIY